MQTNKTSTDYRSLFRDFVLVSCAVSVVVLLKTSMDTPKVGRYQLAAFEKKETEKELQDIGFGTETIQYAVLDTMTGRVHGRMMEVCRSPKITVNSLYFYSFSVTATNTESDIQHKTQSVTSNDFTQTAESFWDASNPISPRQ